ncbi:MAG TPA: phosphatase PAP2 family protein [Thermoflexia bacterium]|nr:phosphatase PAP2 family protein [Thermoflexia bacterium]
MQTMGAIADLRSRLVALDHRLTVRLRVPPGPWHLLALLIAHSGDSPLWLVAGGTAYLWGGPPLKDLGVGVLIANIVGAIATGFLKLIFRRRRPGPSFAGLYHDQLDRMSFPSGHATRVGCMVTLLAPLLPEWATATLAAWAVAVAWARVALGVHYLSDVLAGLILGTALGGLSRAAFTG